MPDDVRRGDPIRLAASDWNNARDAGEAYRRGLLGGLGAGTPSAAVMPTLSILALRDEDDDDLDELCPVKLRWPDGSDPGPVDPADRPLDYQRRTLAYAVSPGSGDEGEAVGITAEPIPAGRAGKVYTTGVVLCTINVTDTAHAFATLTNSATKLASAAAGPCRILWKTTASTGDQQCLVLLNAGTDGTSGFWAEITGNAGGAEPATTYSWKRKVLDPGTHLYVDAAAPAPLTGTNNLKRVPSAGGTPTVMPNGQVVRAWPSPTDPGKYECEGRVTDVTCVGGELLVIR